MLRNKEAVSKIEDMTDNTKFQKVIVDGENKNTTQVIFCSGKIYYEIKERMNNEQALSILIIRLEQLYPFPKEILVEIIKDCNNANFFWCQEEPKNMGAWSFLQPLLINLLNTAKVKNKAIRYVGRKEASSTATGLFKKHVEEQKNILEELFSFKL